MAAFGRLHGTCGDRQGSEAVGLQMTRAGLPSTRTAAVLLNQPARLVLHWEVWFELQLDHKGLQQDSALLIAASIPGATSWNSTLRRKRCAQGTHLTPPSHSDLLNWEHLTWPRGFRVGGAVP